MDLKSMGQECNPSRGYQALVLANYADIVAARERLWGWAEIAEALGRSRQEGKAFSRAFLRIKAKVDSGDLKPGGSSARPRPRNPILDDEPRKPRPTSTGGGTFKNLDAV